MEMTKHQNGYALTNLIITRIYEDEELTKFSKATKKIFIKGCSTDVQQQRVREIVGDKVVDYPLGLYLNLASAFKLRSKSKDDF